MPVYVPAISWILFVVPRGYGRPMSGVHGGNGKCHSELIQTSAQ